MLRSRAGFSTLHFRNCKRVEPYEHWTLQLLEDSLCTLEVSALQLSSLRHICGMFLLRWNRWHVLSACGVCHVGGWAQLQLKLHWKWSSQTWVKYGLNQPPIINVPFSHFPVMHDLFMNIMEALGLITSGKGNLHFFGTMAHFSDKIDCTLIGCKTSTIFRQFPEDYCKLVQTNNAIDCQGIKHTSILYISGSMESAKKKGLYIFC